MLRPLTTSPSPTTILPLLPHCPFLLPPTQARLPSNHTQIQVRHATLLRRPKRPYTFTQLVTLSDGSTYLHRTTSPEAVYLSQKDARNTPLWNPSSEKLMSVEADEAGRLRKFRERFGRGFDNASTPAPAQGKAAEEAAERDATPAVTKQDTDTTEAKAPSQPVQEDEDNLMDLISGYGAQQSPPPESGSGSKAKAKKGGKK